MDAWTKKYGDVSVGYSKDFNPNPDYKAMGLCCEYEHCIENSPFDEEPRCPIFGHRCPGGPPARKYCNVISARANINERMGRR